MSGGTLGIIIPPSIPMIIYGLVTETSVTDLFAAGFGPGILLTVVLSIYAVWFNRHMPTERFDFADFREAFRNGIWSAMMPVILLGGIYTGYFTATEAAAVALCYAMLVEIFIHSELKFSDFYNVVLETSKLGGSLFPVLAIALSLNIILTEHRVPQMLVTAMQGYITSPLMFMLLVNVAAADRRLPDDDRRGDPGAGPAAGARCRGLRLRQGDVRPDHDPQSGDRLSHAAGGTEPDRGHERLQATVRAALPGPRFPSSC